MSLNWQKSLLIPLAASILVAGTFGLFSRVEHIFIERASERADVTLNIAVDGLESTLERFAPLPKLIAERPLLVELLKSPDNQGLAPFVNEQLRLTAMDLGVSDVYLMDISGMTIAASSYRKERSFIGQNFNYRPYFQQAIEGGLGQFFALGTTSGERGYFFSAPVLDHTRILGVLAVKFEVDAFEEAWQGGDSDIIVSDLNGIVFMSSRPDWHFRALEPLSDKALANIEATKRYPRELIRPLDLDVEDTEARAQRVRTEDGERFLRRSVFMPNFGWTVHLLVPAAPITDQAITVALLGAALLLLACLAAALIWQRGVRARDLVKAQKDANEQLERRVVLRTRDLNEANAKLRAEVAERAATEQRLRHTQKELVQAGKLAALGQMSAAISHEINQPLAAMKAYAENATAFISRGQPDAAEDNLSRISQMTDRIASISGHLRNFARRPQETVGVVSLESVLKDVADLMSARLRAEKVTLSRSDAGDIRVVGGQVRLQQVLVNLVNNAIDASAPGSNISIDLKHVQHNRIQIVVRDEGEGFSPEALAHLFDPFYTTKAPGKGMGLGLSISHNIVDDFDGHMHAGNNEDGGAYVAVELKMAPAESKPQIARQA